MINPGTNLGRYRLDRLLGQGGMGSVYLAYDTELHRPVAIKVVDGRAHGPASGMRALQEARSASALSHPNICTVFEVGEANGSAFIAMEYVEGRSVKDRLEEGSLSTDDALRYGLQAADALAHAHERGVVHRDVKAANAMIADTGWLKLVDFGLASRSDHNSSDETTLESVVPAGVVAGTPYSMAPEQVRGASTGSPADVWGLGVLLFEMLTRDRPFQGSTNAELLASVLRDEPRQLAPGVSEDVRALVRRCLTKDPSTRTSATEVRDGIRAILSGARPPRPDQARAAATPGRKRVLVLPFANISADPDTDYFADGLTEELIADLSRVNSLMVISRTSAMKLKGRTDDIRTIAERVGVDLVLDGSVRKGKDSFRISAQLVDATIDSPIWAEKFMAGTENLFEVQERLSRQIIDAMEITLTRTEAAQVMSRPISDPRVYDLYLRAGHKMVRFAAADVDEAVALLKNGLEVLPDNEVLLGQLGYAYVMYVHWGIRPDPKYLDLAQECVDQILKQRPGSSHALGLSGGIAIKRGNLQEAVRHLKGAMRADPSNVDAATWLAYAYMTVGQTESARPMIEMMVRLDPLTGLNHVFMGWMDIVAGRFEDALRHYKRGYDLEPNAPLNTYIWGFTLLRAGRVADGLAHFEQVAPKLAGTIFGDLAVAFSHAFKGDAAKAREAISARTAAAGRGDEAIARFLIQLYAITGDLNEACEYAEYAVARGNLNYLLFKNDPLLRPLQSVPRFQKLLTEVKQRWETFEV